MATEGQATMSAGEPASFCQIRSKRSSRSTSPASTAESASCEHSSSRGSVNSLDNAVAQIEDQDVASPYIVRNTFIATVEERLSSLEGFYDERLVCSCPPTRAPSHDVDYDALSQIIEASSGTIAAAQPQDSDTSYFVRNTFIETSIGRSISLEEFYEERQACSCPPTRLASVEEECSCPPTRLASVDEEHVLFETTDQLLEGLEDKRSNVNPVAVWESRLQPLQQQSIFGIPRQHADESDTLLLLLHDALGMPEVGSAELPSRGSREHTSGSCKPCAFFHAKTCKSGEDCAFCHLCGPEAKKRRQRIKEEKVRAAKQEQEQQATSDSVFNSILQSLQGVYG